MATAALVSGDIEIGRQIVAALSRARIPVTVYLWAFLPQLQEWQFIVATPLVDTKGPLAAYSEVNRTLQKAGVFGEVPLRRIFLKSPNDRVLRSLEKQSKAVPQEAYRVVNEQIAGSFVEEAYLYKGFVHIAQLRQLRGRGDPVYSVMYAPYEGPPSIVPDKRISGVAGLRDFLVNRLHISRDVLASTLRNLGEGGSVAIPNVELTYADLKRVGLA